MVTVSRPRQAFPASDACGQEGRIAWGVE